MARRFHKLNWSIALILIVLTTLSLAQCQTKPARCQILSPPSYTRAEFTHEILDPEQRWKARMFASKHANGPDSMEIFQVTLARGQYIPLHRHTQADEWIYVLSGKGAFAYWAQGDEKPTQINMATGHMLYVPRGQLHQIWDIGVSFVPLNMLVMSTALAPYEVLDTWPDRPDGGTGVVPSVLPWQLDCPRGHQQLQQQEPLPAAADTASETGAEPLSSRPTPLGAPPEAEMGTEAGGSQSKPGEAPTEQQGQREEGHGQKGSSAQKGPEGEEEEEEDPGRQVVEELKAAWQSGAPSDAGSRAGAYSGDGSADPTEPAADTAAAAAVGGGGGGCGCAGEPAEPDVGDLGQCFYPSSFGSDNDEDDDEDGDDGDNEDDGDDEDEDILLDIYDVHGNFHRRLSYNPDEKASAASSADGEGGGSQADPHHADSTISFPKEVWDEARGLHDGAGAGPHTEPAALFRAVGREDEDDGDNDDDMD